MTSAEARLTENDPPVTTTLAYNDHEGLLTALSMTGFAHTATDTDGRGRIPGPAGRSISMTGKPWLPSSTATAP